MTTGWSLYVIFLVVLNIVATTWLLWWTARKRKSDGSNAETTGHVWDEDLKELNTPMPRWWMWLFYITIIFALAYLFLYPGLGTYAGSLGWKSTGQYEEELKKAEADYGPLFNKYLSQDIKTVAADPQAQASGQRLFLTYCAQCHGSDARGSKGFPNLTDNDWLHGGTPEKIRETLEKGRIGNMPPMAAAVGSPEDVRNLSHYVLSLSGSPHDSLRASLGKAKFAACAACHGMDGKGNQALGAPNLTDDIWLHGWGEAAITAMINNGKVNQMPAQAEKLTEAQIGVLSAYVWGLSNKQVAAR